MIYGMVYVWYMVYDEKNTQYDARDGAQNARAPIGGPRESQTAQRPLNPSLLLHKIKTRAQKFPSYNIGFYISKWIHNNCH